MARMTDAQRYRFAEALGELWSVEVKTTDLAMMHFGDPGPGVGATVQYFNELGGDKVTITPSSFKTMLFYALHELAHRHYGPDATEDQCDRYAEIYSPLWYEPFKAYIDRGDPAQFNELVSAMRWGNAQAAKRAQVDYNQRFVQICRKHAVKVLDRRPGQAAPSITFGQPAQKSIAYEVKRWVDEQLKKLRKRKDTAVPDFVRAALTRHKRYIDWVDDLRQAGILPAEI